MRQDRPTDQIQPVRHTAGGQSGGDRRVHMGNLGLVVASILLSGTTAVAGPDLQTMRAGETFHDCPDCPELVVVPAGSFTMGSSNVDTARDLEDAPHDVLHQITGLASVHMARESPEHSVSISLSFALGKYPVMRAEFAAFVRETGYSVPGECAVWKNHEFTYPPEAEWKNPGFPQTDRDPVVCVSWQDANAYITWLNKKLRRGSLASMDADGPYRLPSESEWEYAARAGTRTARWWGDSIGLSNADCDGCGSRWDKKQTAPAGSFHRNPFGLYDMLGNAWQWVEDCWNENYLGAVGDGSPWISGECEQRVIRGGGWSNEPWLLRSAERSHTSPDYTKRANYIGFRVARTLPRN